MSPVLSVISKLIIENVVVFCQYPTHLGKLQPYLKILYQSLGANARAYFVEMSITMKKKFNKIFTRSEFLNLLGNH
jgi:hypothetical protein